MKRSLMCALFAVGAGCSGGGDGLDTSNDELALGLLAPVAVDDELWTVEDLPIEVNAADLVAYDLDADGDALTVVAVTSPRNGTVVLSGGQNITFTPARDFVGDGSFDYVVSDGTSTDVGTVTVHCQPSNDPPLAIDDRLSSPEDVVVTMTVASLVANDIDPDGDTLRITSVNSVGLGKARLAGDVVIFTPLANATGNGRFDYVVSDGQRTDTARVTIALTPVNDAPVAVNDSASTSEDAPLVVAAATLLGNDIDVDSKPLAVSSVSDAVNGTVSLEGADVRFVPAPNFAGTARFTYAAFDGELTSSATVTVAVAAVNDAPVATADAFSTASGAPLAIPAELLLANDVDVEGSPLTLTAVGAPTHGTVTLSAGTVTFTPAPGFEGAAGFTYTVSDGELLSVAQVSVIVFDGNDPPVAVDDVAATAEDTVLALAAASLTGNDVDPDGDPLVVVAVSAASHGTVALSGGQIVFTPAPSFAGVAGFDYVVSDGEEVDVGHVAIDVTPVNDAPVAVADSAAVLEDGSLTLAAGDLVGNDSDVDGDALSVVAVQAATHGTVTLGTGGVVFTPAADYHGPASFEYVVSDGAAVATAVVNVTVTPVEDAPVAVADTATTAEDTALTLAAAVLLGNDTDLDEDPLSLVAVGNAVHGTVALSGDTVTFTPAPDHTGAASFDYTVSDGVLTASGVVNVTVTPVNDLPTADGFTATTAEDTPVSIDVGDLIARGDDVDGDALTVVAVEGAVDGTVVLAGGRAVFTPAADFHGQASFEYQLSDGEGFAVATVVVTVTAVNDAPTAGDDAVTTDEDVAVTIPAATLLGNDRDVDGDTLTITAVGDARHGTVTLDDAGVTFTPDRDHHGLAAAFSYTVSDGTATATASVAVSVTAVNDAPVAGDDAAQVAEDTTLTLAVGDLLGNDRDIDNDALTVVAVGNATGGTVALGGDTVTFSPAPDGNGPASFSYTVSDGALTATGTVAVTITPVNDAPVAADDTAATLEDTALALPAGDLLGNDRDADGDTLRIAEVGDATGGEVVLDGDVVTFTPATNHAGPASFAYAVTDGSATARAVVAITVESVNDAPVAGGDEATTAEDTAVDIDAARLLANDGDIDSPSLAVTAVGDATGGTVALTGSTVTFTPAPNFAGSAGFQYTVSDGELTATGAVAVVVTPVNDAPVAGDDERTAVEDGVAAFTAADLLANDRDVDDDTLRVVAVDNAVNGTVAFDGEAITFTPAQDFHGPASFEYVISDGALTDVAVVTVAVTPVNDAPLPADDAATILEDGELPLAAGDLLGNDRDIDGDALSVVDVRDARNGQAQVADGGVRFVPDANFHGTASFVYVISDGSATASALVTVTVLPVNDAPAPAPDSAQTSEDSVLEIPVAALLGNDVDVDGDTLSVIAVQTASTGTVTLAGGVVTFTPAANVNGPAGFEYVVSDGTTSAVSTVAVAIAPVNDAPVAVADSLPGVEDQPLVVATSAVTGNDVDVDGDALIVTEVRAPVNGTVALSGSTITFTPTANFNGTARFEYVVSDGELTAVGQADVVVAAVNDAPVAVDDTRNGTEDAAVVITIASLVANDTDLENNPLTITAVQAPVNGTVAITGSNVTFQPAANFNGQARFDYVVSDGNATDVGTVVVTVFAVNDQPVPGIDTFSTNEDVPLVVTVAQLLANDVDVEGSTLVFLAATSVSNGTVARNGNNLTFTPRANYAGPAGFDYLVSDGTANATGRVNITVVAVNDAPIPVPDAVATPEDTAVTVAASTLIANDTDVDSPLTLIAVQSPSNGTVSLAGGAVTFVPAANFNGIASFQYVVSDGTTQVAVLVQVTVTAVNDPPVVSALAAVTVAGIAVEVVLTAVDVDGDALTFELASQPGHGTLLGVPPLLTYLPALGFSGVDTFSFRANDGRAVSAPATATITVNLGAAVCGDGRVEAAEACDDGNRVTGDGCDANCSLTGCGNGEVGGFAATALTLEWLGTSCAAAEIAFSVGDTVVHREALSSACGCDAGIGSATVDDPEVLALLAGDTTMSVAITGADGGLAWAVATVATGDGGREVVLFDEGGGGDAELRAADLCVAGYAATAAASAVTELVEECDDGNGEDGDGCSAACLVESAPVAPVAD